MPAKPILKQAYKKTKRYWQHEETGNVAIATWKPSNRWNQINKKKHDDYLADQYCVCKHPVAEIGWPKSLHAQPSRVKKIQERTKKLQEAGDLMSNVFFNWKQQNRFTEEERKMMESLQVNWDAIPKA